MSWNVHRGAAYTANEAGRLDLAAALTTRADGLWREYNALHDQLLDTFWGGEDTFVCALWCCAITDARIALGIEPDEHKTLVDMYMMYSNVGEEQARLKSRQHSESPSATESTNAAPSARFARPDAPQDAHRPTTSPSRR